MTNRITITGRLGQDAELKFLPSGRSVLNLSVGDGKSRRNDSGGYDEIRPTIWHRVAIWGRMAEMWAESGLLVKGAQVDVTGELSIREFEHNGQHRWASEITAYQVGVREPRQSQQQGGGFGQASGFGEPGGPDTPAENPWGTGAPSGGANPPFAPMRS